MTAVNAKRTRKQPTRNRQALRGRSDLDRLRRMSEREIEASSPPELADPSNDFWDLAKVVKRRRNSRSLDVKNARCDADSMTQAGKKLLDEF